jgi:hypothetical protein
MRPLLATLFVFASITVLSQEAHCLGMTLAADHAHTAYHAEHGEAHKTAASHDTHTCDHEKSANAKSDWAIAQPAPASVQKQTLSHPQPHWGLTLASVAMREVPAPEVSTRPPLRRNATGTAAIFVVTSRLLI